MDNKSNKNVEELISQIEDLDSRQADYDYEIDAINRDRIRLEFKKNINRRLLTVNNSQKTKETEYLEKKTPKAWKGIGRI